MVVSGAHGKTRKGGEFQSLCFIFKERKQASGILVGGGLRV